MEQKIVVLNICIDNSVKGARSRMTIGEDYLHSSGDITCYLESYLNDGWVIKNVFSNNILCHENHVNKLVFGYGPHISLTVLLEKE